MPTPDDILADLGALSNAGWGVAVAWHGVLLAVVVALARGRRPSRRLAGTALALPVASAAAAAWWSGNPFNGALLSVVAALLVFLGGRLSGSPVGPGPGWSTAAGAPMVAFGWTYPHFLEATSPLAYLYAAPFGLVPCATLSGVIGFALVGDALGGRGFGLALGVTGVFYGLFGWLRLGVGIDAVLLVGAVALIARALRAGK